MASSDIDQKYLAHLASMTSTTHPLLAAPLYSLLGLSSMLSARVHKAKKLRRLDLSRDTPSLTHYQHIIWLVREGLEILETKVLPHTMNGKFGAEATVLAAKLRASFYHLLSIFHNEPPISQVPPPRSSSRTESASGVLGVSHRQNNSKSSIVSEKFSPKANQSKSKNGSTGRTPTLRDPVASATSDASFITNPYASNRPGSAVSSPAPPPGLGGPTLAPRPSAFLLPAMNFLPITESHFVDADRAATALLPGSHPLRLSTAVEHCAFIWDCLHDFQYARRHARTTIRAVYHAKEGMDDEDFEEAAKMVDQLGKIMKRRSWDGAVRPPGDGFPEQIQEETPQSQMAPLFQDTSIAEGVAPQPTPPSMEQRSLSTQERKIIKAGGGPRGGKYLKDYLRKHNVFQLCQHFKRWLPINIQIRKTNDMAQKSPKPTDPRGQGQAGALLDALDHPMPDHKKQFSAMMGQYDINSFYVRNSGGCDLFELATPLLNSPSPTTFSPPPRPTSPRPAARLHQRPAPINTGLAQRLVKALPEPPCSSPSPRTPRRPPLDLNKPLPPTPCSSPSPSPQSLPAAMDVCSLLSPPPQPLPAQVDTAPCSSTSPPPRPLPAAVPAPIDVETANNAAKSGIIDEYEWSPKDDRPKTKNGMLRNVGGIARYRNEAFPPIDGARMDGNPVNLLLPTRIQLITGELKIVEQYRWVQPVTVFDRPVFEAAVRERDEATEEKARREKREQFDYKVERGKNLYEKLKAKWAWKTAQEAQAKAQQQQHM